MKPSFDLPRLHGLLLALAAVLVAVPASASDQVCGVVDIDGVGWHHTRSTAATDGVDWWIEFGPEMLLCGSHRVFEQRPPVRRLDQGVEASRLWLVRGFDSVDLAQMDLKLILGGPQFGVVLAPDDLEIGFGGPSARHARGLVPVSVNTVLVRQAANRSPRPERSFAQDVQVIVDEVDGDRWFSDVETLATFNRYTHGPGILQARDWLVQRFQGFSGLQVETQSFSVDGTTAYNVIATLAGSARPDDWIIIGGHYDAVSEDPLTATPGAEDNASGCAGVVEAARVLSEFPPEASLIFICYSGEEQGLHGSEAHVDALLASNQLWKVQAMVDMDMIGYTEDPDLDCLLETEEFAESLLDLLADAASHYTDLRIETTFYAWGSDHVPYLRAGLPAILTIENDWSSYPYYHTTSDLPHHITVAMGEEIIKMNVAAVAAMAGATVLTDFNDGFESGDTSGWTLSVP